MLLLFPFFISFKTSLQLGLYVLQKPAKCLHYDMILTVSDTQAGPI